MRRVSESNVEVVRRLFAPTPRAASSRRSRRSTRTSCIEIPPDLSAEPDSYHGHDGARRYFAGFEGMLEDVRYEAIELTPVGELVLAHRSHGAAAARAAGSRWTLDAYVLTRVAGGKITRMRPYPTSSRPSARSQAQTDVRDIPTTPARAPPADSRLVQ